MPSLPSDTILHAAAILAALTLVALFVRRVPVLGAVLQLAAWCGIGLLLVGAIRQRSLFDPGFASLAHYFGSEEADDQQVSGRTLRIPMSGDGHFWVTADIDGVERRLLVDSGATITALSARTAESAGLRPTHSPFPVILQTANGTVAARTARVGMLRIGNIVARQLPVVVSPAFGDTEVVGMNFLSKLKSWRVEGRTLILEPHHPQPAIGAKRDDATT